MWTRRDDSLFDREAGERHERRMEEARRRNAEIDRAEDERTAAERAEALQRSKRNNAVMQLREYARAGVAPRRLDADGHPTESLAMLLDMGWTIEPAFGGGNALIPPPGRK